MATDFTISDVLAWARTKPAIGEFDYFDNTNCALCQFLRETGRATAPIVYGWDWTDGNHYADIPSHVAKALALADGTFKSLVWRLEQLSPATPVTGYDWAAIDAYLTDIEPVSA
jgi:hypothetical protein